MSDGEARLRDELAMLEAQADLARADLPKAGEIERICEWLRAAGGTDEPTERRSLLEAFQVTVHWQKAPNWVNSSVLSGIQLA